MGESAPSRELHTGLDIVATTDTRKIIRMTPEEASNFLDGAMNAALATIDRDG